MNRRFAICAACVFLTSVSMADVSEEESLHGLESIALIVEALHEDSARIGLSTETLRQDAKEQLDNAGIKTLSADERMAHPRRPYLYINCHIIYVESIQLTAFSIDVEVHQRVTLDNGQKAQALTWAKSYLGVNGQEKAAIHMRQIIGMYVDEFVTHATKDARKKEGASVGP